MAAPECPVCLEAYDWESTVPRVLACGHSGCETCLAALPARATLPNAVRCPSCAQTVPLPRPPGPSALPKNFDLLRLSPDPHPNPKPNPKPKPKPPPPQDFFPLPWTEPFFNAWKDWVLPQDSLAFLTPSTAAVSSSLGRPWCLREGQRVSLVRVGDASSSFSSSIDSNESQCFRLSYVARMMASLWELSERVRGELGFVLEASLRQRRGVCRVYGLWMGSNEEGELIFLVAERFDRGLFDFLDGEKREREGLGGTGEMAGFGMVAMELCEVLMGLHSEGIVCSCLAPSSFCLNEFGHCVLDLSDILVTAGILRKGITVVFSQKKSEDVSTGKSLAFVSPEAFLSVCNACKLDDSVGYGSDVWSLACILIFLIVGDASLVVELYKDFCSLRMRGNCDDYAELVSSRYEVWREKMVSTLETILSGSQFESLLRVLTSCLDYNPQSRSQVSDLWHCIRSLFIKFHGGDDILGAKEKPVCCLILSEMCSPPEESTNVSSGQGRNGTLDNISDTDLMGSSASITHELQQEKVTGDIVEALPGFKPTTLQGHHDCITGLAVGGGYLFSSSFDKSIHVWALQDFSHVQTLRGHEHRITAIIVVDTNQPLCISGDSGSGIFIWNIGSSLGQEPLKHWYEHNDWRYSGIHSLAVSETGYLYSGSGDKSIKAWSLQDYRLSFTMTGHKSTVSSLAISEGILYSGSWDGTIRLWWLNNHSPLAVLQDDTPEMLSPVLSLKVERHVLVASCENGSVKMWKNDAFVKSIQIQQGAIFALHVDAKWLFSGGWDKIIDIQELSEDELHVDIRPVASINCDSIITSLLFWDGKLFVGFSNKDIKVYYYGS